MELGLTGRQKYQWREDEINALAERGLVRDDKTGIVITVLLAAHD